jgi:hypothetical protein
LEDLSGGTYEVGKSAVPEQFLQIGVYENVCFSVTIPYFQKFLRASKKALNNRDRHNIVNAL